MQFVAKRVGHKLSTMRFSWYSPIFSFYDLGPGMGVTMRDETLGPWDPLGIPWDPLGWGVLMCHGSAID